MTDYSSYPPSDTTMHRKCTGEICGTPNMTLYNLVTRELLSYLNQPSLTVEQVFTDFNDAPGGFYQPPAADGEWLSWRSAPGWQNTDAVVELLNSSPQTAQDVMSIRDIGPDTYYDMFVHTLYRLISDNGVCLPIFPRHRAGDDSSFQYYMITNQSSGAQYCVRTIEGIPFEVDDDPAAMRQFFVFPTTGAYTVQIAVPRMEWFDPTAEYLAADLEATPNFSTTVNVANDRITLIDIQINSLSIQFDDNFDFPSKAWRLAVINQKHDYWIWKGEVLYNKNGRLCNGGDVPCEQFAAELQEDVEDGINPVRSVRKAAGTQLHSLYFPDLADGSYKLVLFSEDDDDIIVTTACHIEMGGNRTTRVSFPHAFNPYEANSVFEGETPSPLPSKAFLEGDLLRQFQQGTSNCGPFSLALAASYWDPFTYNPRRHNGKWMEDTYGDWPPWTGQGTMVDASGNMGFSTCSRVLNKDNTTREEGITELKKWIAAGIPVIVNIDEEQDTTTFGGEHYKVLIGYDDDAELHYTRDDGSVGSVRGALYFANSGAHGLDEGKPEVRIEEIANTRRENHEDYNYAPIGNDIDSYRAFFYKWKNGGYWPATSDLWYLPFFPAYYRCGKCADHPRHRILNSKIGCDHWRYMTELVPRF